MPDLPAPTASAERRGDRSSSHGRAPRGHQHAPLSTTSRSTTGLGANGTAMACAPAVARFGGWIARPAPGAGLGVAGGHLSTAHPRGRDRHTPGMSDPRIPPTHRPDWPRASRPGSTPSPAAHRQCRRRVSNGSPADVAHPAGRRCRNARRRKSWHDRDQTRPWARPVSGAPGSRPTWWSSSPRHTRRSRDKVVFTVVRATSAVPAPRPLALTDRTEYGQAHTHRLDEEVTEAMYHPTTPDLAARRKELAPEVHEAFEGFSRAVFAEGAYRRGPSS
jgi:hypothetical protein